MYYPIDAGFIRGITSVKFRFLINVGFVRGIYCQFYLNYAGFKRGIASVKFMFRIGAGFVRVIGSVLPYLCRLCKRC